ncbi:MAG TPA: DUF6612 family protein [Dehalococcoidales bacterium]
MKRTMKTTLYIFMGLVLAVSSVLTGCTAKEVTAEELLTNTIAAMEKVNSYKIDYDMAMEMEVVGGTDPMQMTMDGSGTGAMDVRNKKMQMNMDMDMEIPGTGTSKMNMTMSMEMYLVEGWLYTKMNIPGMGEQWTKMETPDEISQDQAAQLMALMKSSTTNTIKGSEKVKGVDCYVLEIVPDMAKLMEWLMSQQGSDLTGDIDLSQFDISKMIKSFGLKYWIAKSNYQIMKAEAEMAMDMDAETVGASEEDFESMTMTMDMGMIFSDYNKTVNIQLPEEALDAEEVSAQ